jgi:hypothetical protein
VVRIHDRPPTKALLAGPFPLSTRARRVLSRRPWKRSWKAGPNGRAPRARRGAGRFREFRNVGRPRQRAGVPLKLHKFHKHKARIDAAAAIWKRHATKLSEMQQMRASGSPNNPYPASQRDWAAAFQGVKELTSQGKTASPGEAGIPSGFRGFQSSVVRGSTAAGIHIKPLAHAGPRARKPSRSPRARTEGRGEARCCWVPVRAGASSGHRRRSRRLSSDL